MPLSPNSQDDNLLVERKAYTLQLTVDEEVVYETDVPASQYVIHNAIIQLYAGEMVFVEAEEVQGKLFLQAVKENRNPEKTIRLSFEQNGGAGQSDGMVLIVHNPFPKDLTYSATVFVVKANDWIPTSVIPVMAGLVAYEGWPYLIATIGLAGWKFKS